MVCLWNSGINSNFAAVFRIGNSYNLKVKYENYLVYPFI